MNWFGLSLGPLIFLFILWLGDYVGISPPARNTLAISLWVAVWWIAEPVPIPVTSLLPVILFPLFGVMDVKTVALAFGNEMIFLYMGGFIIALAIEKTGLHRRIAHGILSATGTRKPRLLLGFMLSSGLLSMWISNTATALLMLPIGLAVIKSSSDNSHVFGKILMFSIAYSCSVGGIATLIGTPTNLIFSGIIEQLYNHKISFYSWLNIGLPVSIAMFIAIYIYLLVLLRANEKEQSEEKIPTLESIGKISRDEMKVLTVFLLVVLLWIVNGFLIKPYVPAVSDMTIALTGAVLLFIIPSSANKNRALMDWNTAEKLPWGVLLLFGGGLAIAEAFKVSGLAAWIGEKLSVLNFLPLFAVLFILVFFINFMTELTSNVATAAMILPVLGSMAMSMNVHPFLLMVGAVMAASCAFMLPVATPPNAVVFSAGYFTIREMAIAGLVMNLISVLVISFFVYFLLPPILEINPFAFPETFK